MKRAALILGLGLLAACNRGGEAELDPAAIDAVALEAEYEMNEAPYAIYQALSIANEQPQVGWETLTINLDTAPEPVNWWFQDKRWIELAGAQFAGRPVVVVSPAGEQALQNAEESWFVVGIAEGAEPEVNCESAAALTALGCEVLITLQPALTDLGRSILGPREFPPVQTLAMVSPGFDTEFQVSSLAPEGQPFWQRGLEAALGPQEVRAAAARAATEAMAGRVQALTGQAEPEIYQPAYQPPNYIDAPPPVPAQGLDGQPGVLGLGLPDAAREYRAP